MPFFATIRWRTRTNGLEAVPQAEQEADVFFRARVQSTVGCKVFAGLVERIERGVTSREKLYHIRYSDSDLEHYTEKLMRERAIARPHAGDTVPRRAA